MTKKLSCFLTAILAGGAGPAGAADQTVANCSNDVELRSDLTSMQQSDGGTLTFSCATSTIVLTSVLPDITKNTKIDGGGKITLSGGNSSRLFFVQASGTLELEDIVLTGGSSSGDGGAVFNFGVTALRRSEVKNSVSGLSGGGIVTYGPLTIEDSTFSGNRGANGGAVYARFPPSVVMIVDSVLHDNETTDKTFGLGGAILLWDGATVTIDGTHLHDNRAAQGGAVNNPFANSSVTIRDSRLEGNIAGFAGFEPDLHHGGAVFSAGTLEIETSAMVNNQALRFGGNLFGRGGAVTIEDSIVGGGTAIQGGGMYIEDDTVITVRRSSIHGNKADVGAGAALNVDIVALFENVTISTNEGEFGTAVHNSQSQVTLSNSTVHMNLSLGSVLSVVEESSDEASFALRNTILSHNTGFTCPEDEDDVVSLDGNLSDDDDCDAALTGLHDLSGPQYDPMLAFAETFAAYEIVYVPQPGSPAVDGGVLAGAPSHDQRGVSRPQGVAIDRGAVEVADCPTGVVCGDASGDGNVVTADALTALRTAAGSASCPLWRCDFNGDDGVTASDALGILRTAVGQSPTASCPDAWDCIGGD